MNSYTISIGVKFHKNNEERKITDIFCAYGNGRMETVISFETKEGLTARAFLKEFCEWFNE